MPYTNVPEDLWDKMDSCVEQVQAEGNDKETAIAICHASIVGGKAIGRREDVSRSDRERAIEEYGDVQYADEKNKKYPIDTEEHIRAAWNYINKPENASKYDADEVTLIKRKIVAAWKREIDEAGPPGAKSLDESLKVGARHNRGDQEALQQIHDGAVTLGAICAPAAEVTETPILPKDYDPLINFGSEVKALGDGRLGGYLITFGGADLTGDYFAPDTDFGEATQTAVYYQHGMDTHLKRRKLGKGDLRVDDVGVWVEAQLAMRDEYEQMIYQMAEAGKLGWSSGTAPHLVEREPDGGAMRIKSWPLGLDASLTPTPAEPRNTVIPLKSYISALQPPIDEAGAGGEPAQSEGGDQIPPIEKKMEEVSTMELTEERLTELIAGAAKAAADEAIKSLPPINPVPGVQVVKDEADQPWETPGAFFKAIKDAAFHPRDEDKRLTSLKGVASGLNEQVPSEGGYLLAPTIAAGIRERMYSVGEVLGRVAVDNIGPNSNGMVYNLIDESSRAVGSAYGGVRGYWLAEAGTKTASKPAFRQVELKLKKIAALCYASDELLADTTALESWLGRTVPEVLRFQVEDAIVNGDGVGKPLGIMSSPCLIQPVRIDANEIDATDIANLWKRRWTGVNDYVWLVSPSIFGQLINMVVGNFPVLMPAFSNVGAAAASPFPTIYGRPVLESEYCAQLGTTGDIILASLSQYQTIQKGGVESASSIHVQFLTDETAFRFVYRIDGAPLWDSALTPLRATDTVSPFVALATASA